MASGCCDLVGNLQIGLPGCIISISTSCSVETGASCGGNIVDGPVIQSVNISGYATNCMWNNCPGKAGVNIPYIRKYDCENDILYIILAGEGQAFVAGDTGGLATLNNSFSSTKSMSASASSGPTSIYMSTTQNNGWGLSYGGNPISFTTSPDTPILVGIGSLGEHYLQSFSFDAQPGQVPIASYNFIKAIRGN